MLDESLPQHVKDRIDVFHDRWLAPLDRMEHDTIDQVAILCVLADQDAAPSLSRLISKLEEAFAVNPTDPTLACQTFMQLIIAHVEKIEQPPDDPSVLDCLDGYAELQGARATLAARQLGVGTRSCAAVVRVGRL